MTAKKYTDLDVLKIHCDYISFNKSLVEFAKKRNLSVHSLRKNFKRLNLKLIPLSVVKKKYTINSNYFKTIDTEEKAYYLGLLFADGCNSGNRIELSLIKRDEKVLIKLSEILFCGTINVKHYKSKRKNTKIKSVLLVYDKNLCRDLENLGCVQRKTFVLKFPHIDPALCWHFIRGYFDGDGSISILKRTNGYLEAQFSIVSTKEMLESIGKILNKIGVNYAINKRHKERKNNNFTLRISGNRQIAKTCAAIYENSNVFLDRKFNKYKRLMEINKNVKR